MPTYPTIEAVAIKVQTHETTLEDLVTMGMELREKKDNVSWELGDLAIDVTRLFGSNAVRQFAKDIGVQVSTIRRYRDVSKAYPKQFREEYALVSWSGFRQLAGREDRFDLIKRAHDENWNFEKICAMTQKDKTKVIDDGLPVPPMPELELCATCRKWIIKQPELVCAGHN
jgi:hypothetical protein